MYLRYTFLYTLKLAESNLTNITDKFCKITQIIRQIHYPLSMSMSSQKLYQFEHCVLKYGYSSY